MPDLLRSSDSTVAGGPAHSRHHLVRRRLMLPLPELSSEGIRWTGGLPGTPLDVELELRNPASIPSSPARARIEAAPFGAFVTGRSVLAVSVPSIPAGARHLVRGRVSTFEAPPPPEGVAAALKAGLLRQLIGVGPGEPAPVILRSAHFPGGLDVVVNTERPVRRNLQRVGGLRSSLANITMFFVGDGQPDHYRFRVDAPSADWDVRLFHENAVLAEEGAYVSRAVVLASIVPPPRTEGGCVTIHVSRTTIGRTIPVEIELQPGVLPPHVEHLSM